MLLRIARQQQGRGLSAATRLWITSSRNNSQQSSAKPKIKLKQQPKGAHSPSTDLDSAKTSRPSVSKEFEDLRQKYEGKEALKESESRDKRKDQSENYQKKAIFATKVGAVANLGLAISKGVVGFSISSTALIADAANSLGDVLCDGVVYYTVKEARKRATPERPWGRGKLEPLGALSVGGLLALTGVSIGYTAVNAALEIMVATGFNPFEHVDRFPPLDMLSQPGIKLPIPEAADDGIAAAIAAKDLTLNNFAALGVSGMSILAKELLFRYTLKAGTNAHSAAVVANAWQHRSDVVISAAVFGGLIFSMMGFPLLDPLAALSVAGVILHHAYAIGADALGDLSDAPAGEKETENLRKTCLKVKGVLEVEEMKARKSGPFLYVEATIGVDGTISASAAHRLAELTRLELLKEHSGRVANAVVHVTPMGSSGLGEQYPAWARDHDFIVQEIKRAVVPLKEVHSVSEVQVYYKDNGLICAKVDILLPPNLTIQEAHGIAVKARKFIEAALPGIGEIDVDLELDET